MTIKIVHKKQKREPFYETESLLFKVDFFPFFDFFPSKSGKKEGKEKKGKSIIRQKSPEIIRPNIKKFFSFPSRFSISLS